MTFSIAGRCQRSGMLGIAITTSSICVGARCPHVRAGVGAVSTQNVTDPTLGPAVLDEIERGQDAQEALRAAINNRENLEYRQVTVVDHLGNTACHSGTNTLGVNTESAGSNCFSAGNLLANESVTDQIVDAFDRHQDQHLGERLLLAIEAGLKAGGEAGEVHSAALLVMDQQPFPLVDLRVDWRDIDPVGELRKLWIDYQPQMNDYLVRALNPAEAPSYGVPGDE